MLHSSKINDISEFLELVGWFSTLPKPWMLPRVVGTDISMIVIIKTYLVNWHVLNLNKYSPQKLSTHLTCCATQLMRGAVHNSVAKHPSFHVMWPRWIMSRLLLHEINEWLIQQVPALCVALSRGHVRDLRNIMREFLQTRCVTFILLASLPIIAWWPLSFSNVLHVIRLGIHGQSIKGGARSLVRGAGMSHATCARTQVASGLRFNHVLSQWHS